MQRQTAKELEVGDDPYEDENADEDDEESADCQSEKSAASARRGRGVAKVTVPDDVADLSCNWRRRRDRLPSTGADHLAGGSVERSTTRWRA